MADIMKQIAEADLPENEGQETAGEAGPEEKGEPEELLELLKEFGLDRKFRSLKDALKAYVELEKKFSKDAQEKARLKKELEELRRLTQPQPQQQKDEELEETFLERFYEKPRTVVDQRIDERVRQYLEPMLHRLLRLEYRNTVQELQSTYPDFNQYTDDIAEIIDTMPQILQAPNGLELAYRLAKARRLEQEIPKVREQAREEGERRAAEKQAARVGGTGPRRVEKEPTPEEEVLQRILKA